MAPLDGNKKGLRVQIKQVRRGRWLGGKGGGGRWGGGGQGLSRWIDDYEIFVDLTSEMTSWKMGAVKLKMLREFGCDIAG